MAKKRKRNEEQYEMVICNPGMPSLPPPKPGQLDSEQLRKIKSLLMR